MTTVVFVKKSGQIAIAGDTQTTFGDTRLCEEHDAHAAKIFLLQDNYIAISGSAAHDLVLKAALAELKNVDFSSRLAIFQTFLRLHPILKEKYYLKPDEDDDDPYESSQMTVLIANPHGIFAVYSLREVYEYQKYWAIGSGREYAIGAMHAVYDQPATSASQIAEVGVHAGCAFDVNSALPMNLYTLNTTQL